MSAPTYIVLEHRGLLAVSGPEARDFLQGLVSNDVSRVSPERAIYATLLTPQGKFLHDLFIAELDGALMLDCEAARRDDLERRLVFYRLRAKVDLAARDDLAAVALIGDGARTALGLADGAGGAAAFAGGVAFVDPRLAGLGARAIVPREGGPAALEAAGFAAGAPEDYERVRLACAVPEGGRDLVVEKGLLLENGIDDLAGVDFEKGCYVGQELTARMKYRAKVRKRLYQVEIDGPLPAPDTPVEFDGKAAGVMRSGLDGTGLALLKSELVDAAAKAGRPLTAGDARLTPRKPDWASY